jgi:hypothetical protein
VTATLALLRRFQARRIGKPMMKLAVFAILALVSTPALAAQQVCLELHNVLDITPSNDGNALTFRMRNGQHWRNDLKGGCPDLKFSGFSWVLPGLEEVCDDQQFLHVFQTGDLCRLGKFTQTMPAQSRS